MTMGIVLTTSGQMEIVVHDDAAAMAKLFKLPVAKRLGALAAMRGVSEFDEPAMKQLRQIHERGDGFRVGVDDPRYPAALKHLVEADAWGQLKRDLARAWEYQQSVLPGIHHAEAVDVVLTLGIPTTPCSWNARWATTGWARSPAASGWWPGLPITTCPGSAPAGCTSWHTTFELQTWRATSTSRSGSSTRASPRLHRRGVRARFHGGVVRAGHRKIARVDVAEGHGGFWHGPFFSGLDPLRAGR
jgi:hypothetical protein